MKRLVAVALVLLGLPLVSPSAAHARRRAGSREPSGRKAVRRFDEITLARTACYGSCPIYKVTIRWDGTVAYEGERFVKVTGRATGRLTKAQLDALADALDAASYASLRATYTGRGDGCPTWWTDNPSAVTSVTIAGKKKTVTHNYGCQERDERGTNGAIYPKALTDFETRIDEIVDTGQWTGKERPTPPRAARIRVDDRNEEGCGWERSVS